MRLRQITEHQEINEWLFRSQEWKNGFLRGSKGGLLEKDSEEAKSKEYRKGWEKGYIKYVTKMRPDLGRP